MNSKVLALFGCLTVASKVYSIITQSISTKSMNKIYSSSTLTIRVSSRFRHCLSGRRRWRNGSFTKERNCFSTASLKCSVEDFEDFDVQSRGFVPKVNPVKFSPEPARLTTFSEEFLRIHVPIQSYYQKLSGVAFVDGGIHVLSSSPIGIHSFWGFEDEVAKNSSSSSKAKDVSRVEQQYTRSWLHLDDFIPYQVAPPQLISLDSINKVGIYLPSLSLLISLSPKGGACHIIRIPKYPSRHKRSNQSKSDGIFSSVFSGVFGNHEGIENSKILDVLSAEGKLVVLKKGNSCFDIISVSTEEQYNIQRVHLPEDMHVSNIILTSKDIWLIDVYVEDRIETYFLKKGDAGGFRMKKASKHKLDLQEAFSLISDDLIDVDGSSKSALADSLVYSVNQVHSDDSVHIDKECSPKFSHPNALIQWFANFGSDRMDIITVPPVDLQADGFKVSLSTSLKHSGQMLTIKEPLDIPRDITSDAKTRLELVDLRSNSVRTIFPSDINIATEKASNEGSSMNVDWVDACEVFGKNMAAILQTQGAYGMIRLWEVDSETTNARLKVWKDMFGIKENGLKASRADNLELLSSKHGVPEGISASPPELDTPKHGKEDPDNNPHVGGNTWAGGTGGSNTAGLGGRGGPYRLDKGHKVHQVSEAAKAEVDEELKQKAREINRKAFAQRLQEIDMSESQQHEYDRFYHAVEEEIAQLRVILQSVEAKTKERVWLKNQSFGDLDDSRLVDGVTGEKLIYKRRGTEDSTPGIMSDKPKRLRFVMDCSGSMYRFNGQDGRLERQCAVAVMLMEALEGFETRFQYSIVGHSGEDNEIPLVDYGSPPKTAKERLKVVQQMVAHSQFCYSGDMTLEATELAIKDVVKEDADDYFVFVLSDANLRRYGISPQRFGQVLQLDEKVNAFAIFIASIGEEADRLKKELPAGKSFISFDTSELPLLLRQILVSQVLQ